MELSSQTTELFDGRYLWVTAFLAVTLLITRLSNQKDAGSAPDVSNIWFRWKYLTAAPSILSLNYHKLSPKPFSFRTLGGRRQLILSAEEHIEHLQTIPEDVCSFAAWSRWIMQLDYLMPWHTPSNKAPATYQPTAKFVKQELTSNINGYVLPLQNEAAESFPSYLSCCGIEKIDVEGRKSWTVQLNEFTSGPVVRMALRVFVGLPHCQDDSLVQAISKILNAIATGSFVVSLFPRVLKPWAARWLTDVEARKKEISIKLKAIADERLIETKGERVEDYLDTLIQPMKHGKWDMDAVVKEFLITMFSASHSTAYTNSVTLIELGGRPEYQKALRKEVRSCISKHGGLNETALDAMWKLDSFLKESQRLRPMSAITLTRVAVKEFRFPDGTRVTPGTHVAAIADARYHDDRYYTDPEEFDGFRFSRMREQGEQNTGFTDLSTAFPMFGAGRHACPGRFFATTLTKTLLSHVLLNYDIAIEGGERPRNVTFEEHNILPGSLKLVFTELKS